MNSSTQQAAQGIVCTPHDLDLVHAAGLLDFDAVMRMHGQMVKQTGSLRSVVRVQVHGPGGEPVCLYLKRHTCRPLQAFWQCLLRNLPCAVDEFEVIRAFQQRGIPTMVPVAAGRRRHGVFGRESFMVTRALEGCERLDHLLARRPGMPTAHKRTVIDDLAALVRGMHAAGFNHRDLYLCHILCAGDGRLFVVDLHRVQQRGRVPRRWLVKDLAALNYSAPRPAISRTDRLRFLLAWLGSARCDAQARRFVFSILKKTQKMIQHNANTHGNCTG